jgi:hypothetical protein
MLQSERGRARAGRWRQNTAQAQTCRGKAALSARTTERERLVTGSAGAQSSARREVECKLLLSRRVWREGGGEVAGGLVEVKSWPARWCQGHASWALGCKRARQPRQVYGCLFHVPLPLSSALSSTWWEYANRALSAVRCIELAP